MAIKKSVKKAPNTAQRLEAIEGLLRSGFRQVDQRFEQVDQRFEQIDQRFEQVDKRFEQVDQRFDQLDRRLDFEVGELKREIAEQGAFLGQRIDQLANHVDGFMKLHETLDIEFKVIKEQMNRLEVRLARLEAARAT